MILFPNAKINLGLRIIRKRADGFHDLESVFYPVPWKDSLEIMEADAYAFEQYGFKLNLDGQPNIVEQAYALLQQHYDLPSVKMALLKNIPAGAGLGGGSADAVFAMQALDELLELNIPAAAMHTLAGQLGSDCPFFLHNQPMKVTGTGDQLEPVSVSLAGYHLVIVYPRITVSTPWAYGQITPTGQHLDVKVIANARPEDWDEVVVNDFEEAVSGAHQQIGKVKEHLYEQGALFALMSGSGSAVYGIFSEAPDHVEMARKLRLPLESVFSGIL